MNKRRWRLLHLHTSLGTWIEIVRFPARGDDAFL